MKKRFIFTEEQIKRFIGENFAAYLDKNDSGSDFNEDSLEKTNNEIKPEADKDDEPITTNDIAKQKIPRKPWFSRSYNTLYEGKKKILNDKGEIVPEKCPKCGSKVGLFIKGEPVYLCTNHKCNEYFGTMPCNLNERNQYLDDKSFRLGKKTNQMIDNISTVNTGDKMLNNMSDEKDTSLNTMYVRLKRIRDMKTTDPNRYNNINGKKLEKSLQSTIDNAKNIGDSLKNTQTNTIDFDNKQKTNIKKGNHKEGSTITYYENN